MFPLRSSGETTKIAYPRRLQLAIPGFDVEEYINGGKDYFKAFLLGEYDRIQEEAEKELAAEELEVQEEMIRAIEIPIPAAIMRSQTYKRNFKPNVIRSIKG